MKISHTEILKHNVTKAILLLAMIATPAVAMAQASVFSASASFTVGGSNASYAPSATEYDSSGASSQTNTLSDLVTKAIEYFNQAIFLIIALAVVTFIWNVYRYFIMADSENRKEASVYVLYSVVGLFVILSFWGLVNIVSNTFNLNTTANSINIQALTGDTTSS